MRLMTTSLSLLVLAAASVSGCCVDEYSTSSCGSVPSSEITGFEVQIRTGAEATNADIFFCYALVDSPRGTEECALLDDAENNFEENVTETFDVSVVPFEGRDFDTFWIENRGGGFLGEADWDIDALRVRMRSDDGLELLYEETSIICNEEVNKDDKYVPGGCTWD